MGPTLSHPSFPSLTSQIEGLKKTDNGVAPPWAGLLNGSPVAVPLPTQRVVYVLNFNGDIAASQASLLSSYCILCSSHLETALEAPQGDYCCHRKRKPSARR
jgi:hypothetical protein